MSEQGHYPPVELGHDDQFEREMRGYNRRAVDEYVAALRIDLRSLEDAKRDLEVRLSQSLDDGERLKLELSAARSAGKPAHQEISERIGQILKLADDEAKSQRARADDEIAKLRSDAHAETTKLRADVKAETDKTRAEAHEQAERMLSAAQEQAENTVTNSKSEADKIRKSATSEAQQALADATKQAETAVATAKAQAKQQLDEATARATAIHDGAERRLNLLVSRHTDSIRRLTEIRDVVTNLVAGEIERGSLEDEVARSVAGAIASSAKQPAGPGDGRHASAPGQANSQPAAQARAAAGLVGAGSPAEPAGQPGAAGPARQAGPVRPVGPARPAGSATGGGSPAGSAAGSGSPAGSAAGSGSPAGSAAGSGSPAAGSGSPAGPAGGGPAIPGQRQPVVTATGQQPSAGNGAPRPAQPGSGQDGRLSDVARPGHANARHGRDSDDTTDDLKIVRD